MARLAALWSAFRRWRGTRPFWAGVSTLVAALVLAVPPFHQLKFGELAISISTIGGGSALVIATLLVISGLSLWIRPELRLAAGITTVVLSLVSLVTTNLGSFLVGTMFGIVGGNLAIAWRPGTRQSLAEDSPEGQAPDAERESTSSSELSG